MGEIVIRYSGRMMERTLYWIVIIILAALLILSYVIKDDCDPDKVTEEVEEEADAGKETPEEPEETPEETPEEEPEEPEDEGTCLDGIQNQDETDVDCGGSSCNACAEGKKCQYNSDCREAVCTDDLICLAEPVLSGERTVKIKSVDYVERETNNAAKVTELTIEVENGVDEILSALVEIWVKTDDGEFYLNQPDDFDAREDGENPYGEYSLPLVPAGDTKSYTIDRDTSDAFTSGDIYSLPLGVDYAGGDDFRQEGHEEQGKEEVVPARRAQELQQRRARRELRR